MTDLNTYDEVPYSAKPFYDTHPDHLAAIGTLYGLEPPTIDACRVLELGCANGANLLPMAVGLPESTFVGVDLSSRQVEDGSETLERLGIKNARLRAMSILDIDESFGKFDYIICHGVYSWVPPEVQDKILEIASRNLVPGGLAYVSYNTYPGWHIRAIAREMLKFHVRNETTLSQRLNRARSFLEFVVASLPNSQTAYGQLLKDEIDLLHNTDASYLAHEHLEQFNQPLYFSEFMERASKHRLQYLSEARFSTTSARLSPEAIAQVQQFADDRIAVEQYLDFFQQRTFRRSILCHHGSLVEHPPSVKSLGRLRFTASIGPSPENEKTDLSPKVAVTFRGPDRTMTTDHPAAKAAALIIWERWPQRLTFEELSAAVNDRISEWPDAAIELPEVLLKMAIGGLLGIKASAATFQTTVSDRPTASPVARMQASQQPIITNLQHQSVMLQEIDLSVLRLLDGSRSRDEIVRDLIQQALDGSVSLQTEAGKLEEPEQIRQHVRAAVPESLTRLANSAMLVN